MTSYTTLDGHVLDLSSLTDEEHAFLEKLRRAYADDDDWMEVSNRVTSVENPVLAPSAGRITRAAWKHPLFQAAQDLSDRIGIRQGELAPEGNIESDPFEDAWIPATEAATRKSVTRYALHLAIRRGEVIARTTQPDSNRLLVSANSLAEWEPNRKRQAAGRAIQAKARRGGTPSTPRMPSSTR